MRGEGGPQVVLLHRLPSDVAPIVEEACARAGAIAVASDCGEASRPDLVVAHLPPGVRRISRDVLDLVRGEDEGVPLLVVCDDELVRPASTIRLGAVTLVGRGAHERLSSQLRVMLRARAGRAAITPLGIEQASMHAWYATVGARVAPSAGMSEELTFLLPLGPCDADLARDAHTIVTSRHPDTSAALVERLGDNAGLVHLSREARRWTLYWPCGKGALWLFSPQRLPRLSELSHRSDAPRFFCGPATPCEVVLASTREQGACDRAIVQAMQSGGPASLDLLRALRQSDDSLVVEVR
jgi:hypothetical protein